MSACLRLAIALLIAFDAAEWMSVSTVGTQSLTAVKAASYEYCAFPVPCAAGQACRPNRCTLVAFIGTGNQGCEIGPGATGSMGSGATIGTCQWTLSPFFTCPPFTCAPISSPGGCTPACKPRNCGAPAAGPTGC